MQQTNKLSKMDTVLPDPVFFSLLLIYPIGVKTNQRIRRGRTFSHVSQMVVAVTIDARCDKMISEHDEKKIIN